ELNTLLIEKKKLTVPSIEEGAEEYIPPIALSKRGNRLLEVEVVGNQIRISLDEKPIENKIMLNEIGEGSVYLESAFSGYGYSQRNLADDVYDGVFEKLVITQAREEIILYDNRLKKLEKVMAVLKSQWDRLIGWFVKNF
ncbi:MAG TPA: glycoside hydrolase, partial [Epulopiscium sp.]|nr:glycoside hydrolase [Candidatus Epulonipiscium sp.]